MDPRFLDRLRALRDPAGWLGTDGSWATWAAGIVSAFALVTTFADKLPWAGRLLLFFGLLITAPLLRKIAKEIYLRSGRAPRLGIAYDPVKVDREDWVRVKRLLSGMLTDGTLDRVITIKVIPLVAIERQKDADKFQSRYQFDVMYRVQWSRKIRDTKPTDPARQPDTRLDAMFRKVGGLHNLLNNAIIPAAFALAQNRGRQTTVADLIETNARGLHDAILLIVVGVLLARDDYEASAAILEHLEKDLAQTVRNENRLLRHVRRLICVCRLRPAQIDITALRDRDRLERARQFAEGALRLFDVEPACFFVLARLQFLLGDADSAFDLNERILAHAESHPTNKATAYLNRGFLCATRAEWQNSAAAYRTMLSIPEHASIDWKDLIEFADLAAEWGFDSAMYARALYRRIARKAPLDGDDAKQLAVWLRADPSRAGLKYLLENTNASKPAAQKKSRKNRARITTKGPKRRRKNKR